MANEMLLINPRRRRKAKKASKRSRRRNPIAARRSTMRISGLSRHRSRRRNPIASFGRRRRRNPISLGSVSSKNIVQILKDAALGGSGGILMDIVMGQLNGFLPASFQSSKTTIGVGDAVKAAVTVALGQVLAKPTKGLSKKLAAGALTVQAYEVLSSFVPATMTLGYASPAAIVNGSNRVGPTRAGMLQGLNAYQRPGTRPPLLNAYTTGRTPLLNGVRTSVQQREGISTYR